MRGNPAAPVLSSEGKADDPQAKLAPTGGTMDIIIAVALGAALTVAVVTDLRSQRIYNWLTFPLIVSGLLLHAVVGGLDGLFMSAAGFGLGLAVMLVPFLLGMMGAGDVKLMAGVGAWIGASAVFTAFIFTCLAGGVYALLMLCVHRDKAKAVLQNIQAAFFGFMATRRFEFAPSADAALPRLCYGVAIAVGAVAAVALNVARTGSVLAQ